MANFGGQSPSSARQISVKNVTQASLTFYVTGILYTLLPNESATLNASDADSSQELLNLLVANELELLTVVGDEGNTSSSSSDTLPPGIDLGAVMSAVTGNFNGVQIDPITGRWLLEDGNRLIYPNSVVRQQPVPGLSSTITIQATVQRLGINGTFGFALYTDATTTSRTFNNGYLITFTQNGQCQIFGIRNNSQTAAAYTTQISFPVDVNEHTYSVGLAQPISGSTTINAYVDGNLVSSANLFSNFFYTNGIFGFSTLQGCSDLLITPTSVEYTIGLGAHESTSLATQKVISNVNGTGQLNLGTATGGGNTLPYNANTPAVLAALNTLGQTVQSALPPLVGTSSSVLPASGGYGSTPTYIAAGGTTNNLLTLDYYVQTAVSQTSAAANSASWTAVVLSNNPIGAAMGNAITVTFSNLNSTQLKATPVRWTGGTSAPLGASVTVTSQAFNDLSVHDFRITYYGSGGTGQLNIYIDGSLIENTIDSAILGEGYCGITANSNASSYNVKLTIDTSIDTYEQGSIPTKAVISSAAAGDGSYLQPGIVAGRHLLGATSTDTSAVADSSGRLLYSRQSPALTAVISSTSQLNVNPSGGVTNNLPLANHATPVQTVINSGGTYNANLATGDLPFANHDSAVQGTFTRASSSQLTISASTLFVGQSSVVPASTNFLNGGSIGTPQSSATAYTTIGGNPVYAKISLSWPTWTINYPNGTVGPTSGTYPAFGPQDIYVDNYNSTGSILQPNTNYYLSFYYNYGTNGNVTTGIFSTPALSQAAAATYYADGNITLFINQGPVFIPAKPGSGSSTGSPIVPYQPTCPGYNQLIETKRGHIPAYQIIPGDYLRGWLDGEWNKVFRVGIATSDIYEVEIEGEKFQVDQNHLWWTPYGWWDTKWLHRGDVVMNAEGGVLVVDSLTNLGKGKYIKIKCENQRFRIGKALGHNVVTYSGN